MDEAFDSTFPSIPSASKLEWRCLMFLEISMALAIAEEIKVHVGGIG